MHRWAHFLMLEGVRWARGTSRRRRVGAALLAWVLTFGAMRAVVLHPERCGTVTTDRLDGAIDEAVAWAGRTLRSDGTWIYRYNAGTDTDAGIYELVRHSGLTMALYQAAAAGHPDARAIAEQADTYARTNLVARDGWQALAPLVPGEHYDIGATSLFLNALLYRRTVTASTADDALLTDLGRFLLTNIAPSGAVAANWDPGTGAPVVGASSPFYTGEALWALTRLERVLPGEWREPALRVARYIATARDEAEHRFPDVADHWAAYALAELAHWPGTSVLDEELTAYARHVGELESLSIRYESQRTGSTFSRLTRGQIALGAGVGALTEALASLRSVPALSATDSLRDRSLCGAGVLLDRQTTATEAERYPNPERARGAWIREGQTQIDDQQHALSALLLIRDLQATP
ncbi:unannotated protein [freshwater metagenome]|uniref:Unannotated protein n=1 Tax=freshwater metagenome TaxID=449393 RepID=A0A6J6SF22_9ZZZZ